ncbi:MULTISPECIES: type II toxin-antitoxin system RelE/ParE family toxin [Kosakonia]|uniref:type II toxin-antitoxin system RelE/ParE family toxin n=1 Tax=Kosakonia TaxID=1330547 RepID=UPI000272EE69|nr:MULTISPECIES: type II toxin-antitoxin system RelE/ParE family toxin [Kosakonia]SEL12053.1 Plasmid stabilization system protein ParE [Kosakonia sacchari]APG17136.1 hypothetical protein A3780_06030 [Kosakonia radicincitans]ARD61969.1 hypothetical protein Y71_19335 [Kosakonia radicincitans DSM 16656]KDE37855.1 plasmid stabilization protein [Kosakonia radicincitans UMEnt01/12]MDD7995738.1 type II toxin-antitoxin system RelE/ParE family toxin [Kosakonia radicincitans]
MQLEWTRLALQDVERLSKFLFIQNPEAARKVVIMLADAPEMLLLHPQIGPPDESWYPREVRSLFVGSYEMIYELTDSHIIILRIWHTKEDR